MQTPPHPLPQELNPVGILPDQHVAQVPVDQRPDARTASAHTIGVPESLGTVAVYYPHCDELEVAHVAVGAVLHGVAEGHLVQAHVHLFYPHSHAPSQLADQPGIPVF
ncbi:hypothetical protein SDC9_126414 [bioreactor metagenome]|uniref:Uncharacterized protein n=1 Tax=bioreactor metagenome TaxID=1076179 RepID=A0A645CR31_9ZZZZ